MLSVDRGPFFLFRSRSHSFSLLGTPSAKLVVSPSNFPSVEVQLSMCRKRTPLVLLCASSHLFAPKDLGGPAPSLGSSFLSPPLAISRRPMRARRLSHCMRFKIYLRGVSALRSPPYRPPPMKDGLCFLDNAPLCLSPCRRVRVSFRALAFLSRAFQTRPRMKTPTLTLILLRPCPAFSLYPPQGYEQEGLSSLFALRLTIECFPLSLVSLFLLER